MSRVRTIADIPARRTGTSDTDTIAVHVTHEAADSTGLRQSILRCDRGLSHPRAPGAERIEVLFVVAGEGTLHLDGAEHPLRPETAAFVAAGETYRLSAGDAGLELVSVSAPETAEPRGDRQVTIDLAAQVARDAVSEREYRVLFEPDSGCAPITQFVGYIPKIRTPLHYHAYSEMLYVLSGRGQVEIEKTVYQVSAGSAFYLPSGCHHLVENLGDEHLLLLGVFRPAGSPDVSFPVEDA